MNHATSAQAQNDGIYGVTKFPRHGPIMYAVGIFYFILISSVFCLHTDQIIS